MPRAGRRLPRGDRSSDQSRSPNPFGSRRHGGCGACTARTARSGRAGVRCKPQISRRTGRSPLRGGSMRRSLFKPPDKRRALARLRFTKRTTAAALGGVASLATIGAIVASAAVVPTFPDNVVVFPDRDFVTIEGYQDHVGETGTVTVTRGGQVIGSAQGKVEAGDVAFEVNHPGGYCWGAGTGLNVTPDIRPGDVVTDQLPRRRTRGDTTVADAFVTADAVQDGNRTRDGHVGQSPRCRRQAGPGGAAHRRARPGRHRRRQARRARGSRAADAGRPRAAIRPRWSSRRRHLRRRHTCSTPTQPATPPTADDVTRPSRQRELRRACDVLAGRGRRRQPAAA